MKIPFINQNPTHPALETERQKTIKHLRKQLIIGVAAITAIGTATVILNKVLDVPAAEED